MGHDFSFDEACLAMKPLILSLALLCVPLSSSAQEVVLGLGYSDFSGAGSTDSAVATIEVHSAPKWRFAGADVSLAGAVDLHRRSEFWAGAGVAAVWPLKRNWFVEASVMPGYYEPGNSGNYLGSHFEIRSLLGLGIRLNDNLAVSLAATHKSNAGTGDRNPGVNALMLRTRIAF